MSARGFKTRRAVKRAKEIWSDMDYAQRRAFEIRTGIPVIERRARIARSADELERLYAA
jgi:hypothetical protein